MESDKRERTPGGGKDGRVMEPITVKHSITLGAHFLWEKGLMAWGWSFSEALSKFQILYPETKNKVLEIVEA